jgi:hypothetical protein
LLLRVVIAFKVEGGGWEDKGLWEIDECLVRRGELRYHGRVLVEKGRDGVCIGV